MLPAVLMAFVDREGHARVPKGHVEDGVRLAGWVNGQRMDYARHQLSTDRVARLSAVEGWSWDAHADRWDANFVLLQGYVAREGDARVPADYVERDARLGAWVGRQRSLHAKGTLSPERNARLASINGWTWRERSGPR